VKLLVECNESPDLLLVIVEPAGKPLHPPDQLPQPLKLAPLYASRRAPCGVPLEYGAQVVDIPHVL
jgi:hypothetical protein